MEQNDPIKSQNSGMIILYGELFSDSYAISNGSQTHPLGSYQHTKTFSTQCVENLKTQNKK